MNSKLSQSELLKKHKKEIIKDDNMISLIFNGYKYSLLLNDYQLKKFEIDFDDNNQYYDFTFWKAAIYLFGTRSTFKDLPE